MSASVGNVLPPVAHLQCFAGRTGRTHGTTAGYCVAGKRTGGPPKGAGRALALPRKNNLACRNENRAIVDTGMNILSEQKLEVC